MKINPKPKKLLTKSGLVSLDIIIDGKPIDDSLEVFLIDVFREVNEITSASIGFLIAPEESDAKEFNLGNKIEIQAGYDSKNKTIFKGIISSNELEIDPNAGPVLTLGCVDKAYEMTTVLRSNSFEKKTDSEIMKTLIENYNLTSNILATKVTHPKVEQKQSSDWDFILSRAKKNKCVVNTQDGTVIINKLDMNKKPIFELTYGDDILSFKGAFDIADKGSKPGSLENRMSLHGAVSFQGDEAPSINSLIELKGLGKRFNGKALITGVHHLIADGEWVTTIFLGLEKSFFQETTNTQSSTEEVPVTTNNPEESKDIISKSDLKVLFDDENKVLKIITPGKQEFVLSDKDKSITVKDMSDNLIEMTSTGITMDSKKDIKINADGNISLNAKQKINLEASRGDVSIKGLNIKAKADMSFEATGSATAKVSGDAELVLKGAMVMIN